MFLVTVLRNCQNNEEECVKAWYFVLIYGTILNSVLNFQRSTFSSSSTVQQLVEVVRRVKRDKEVCTGWLQGHFFLRVQLAGPEELWPRESERRSADTLGKDPACQITWSPQLQVLFGKDFLSHRLCAMQFVNITSSIPQKCYEMVYYPFF